jgi:hypothetical protein
VPRKEPDAFRRVGAGGTQKDRDQQRQPEFHATILTPRSSERTLERL